LSRVEVQTETDEAKGNDIILLCEEWAHWAKQRWPETWTIRDRAARVLIETAELTVACQDGASPEKIREEFGQVLGTLASLAARLHESGVHIDPFAVMLEQLGAGRKKHGLEPKK